jgi:hypothetical protein
MPLNYVSIGYTEHEKEMLADAEQAIEKADMWEYMKEEPRDGGGYMFSDDAELKAIYKNIKYDGHSGSSMGWTMRQMQQLARLGIDEFCAWKSGMRIGPEVVAPVRQPRTAEMDTKVINAYNELKAFQRAPKWASDYATLYPACIANLKFA